jgi:geranylgeranyl reductase family protein|uniref:NAD(P)/FAD-dependent oxidoreductase n=1 Tax=candidate division WOR-3 bacterium TaxID=2052148 RepID=A0A7C4XLG7_UNCW3
MNYDVLVIGAGPAGAMTSQIIAKEGFSVLMVDRKKEIGIPVQCAEYIPALLGKEVKIPDDAIAQRIKGLRVHLPDGHFYEFSSPGHILNRSIFDKYLVLDALKYGARLWLKANFLELDKGIAVIQYQGRMVKINAQIIVGADGPSSRVSRLINKRYNGYVVAYQNELPAIGMDEYAEVYFSKEFFGGYAWFFPKNRCANVGVGVKAGYGINVQEVFKGFLQKLVKRGKVIDSPIRVVTGLIPVAGPVLNTVKGHILLVGDAAGQTHPITGAGIPQAIICGRYAGEAIVQALKHGDLKLLKNYEREWQNLFQNELKRAQKKRKILEENWTNLEMVLKECWVSFPEYYE